MLKTKLYRSMIELIYNLIYFIKKLRIFNNIYDNGLKLNLLKYLYLNII